MYNLAHQHVRMYTMWTYLILLHGAVHAEQVRVEDAEENMYASIDVVCDKIARKLSKVKDHAIQTGKWHSHGRRPGNETADDMATTVRCKDHACVVP